jgi:hypothetical protein
MYRYNQLQALKINSTYKTLIKSAIKCSFCKGKTIVQWLKTVITVSKRHFRPQACVQTKNRLERAEVRRCLTFPLALRGWGIFSSLQVYFTRRK